MPDEPRPNAERDASLRVQRRVHDAARIIKDPVESAAARRFAIEAARSLHDDKCEHVVVLDLRGLSQVTEFFVIASGLSERQMRSAGQHVEDLGKRTGMGVIHQNLRQNDATWVALDLVDVIVHVFEPETRRLYDLEMLWGDAPRVEWRREDDAPPDAGPTEG